jgi:peptidoglycan biosynthesis protein MviN/MurJ (putative lipid II flippase)
MNSIFFSHGQTSKITKFALFTLIFNISSNAILFYFISFYSVALATFFSSVFNLYLLISYGLKKSFIFFNHSFFIKIKKILILNFFLILFLLIGNVILKKINPSNMIIYNAFVLGEISFSIIFYFAFLYYKMKYRLSFFKKLFI